MSSVANRRSGKPVRIAAIIDSQSVKSAEKGAGIDLHGFDVRKKIKGKKRGTFLSTH